MYKEKNKNRKIKNSQLRYSIILICIIIVTCVNNGKTELSKKEIFVQQKNEVSYIIPQGNKYTELREVDLANPPVVLSIADRKLNLKKFDLRDYYSKVRYITLKYPMQETIGNFLFDARYITKLETGGMTSNREYSSLFKFTDSYIIAGDNCFGIHCYDMDGRFLYTIESNDFPKSYSVSENSVSVNQSDRKGFMGGLSANKNICMYNLLDDNKKRMLCLYDLSLKERIITKPFEMSATILDANSFASYVYHPLDTTRDFLFTFNIKGDTLCRFLSYNPVSERKEGNFIMPPSADMYYYNDQLTIRQSLNDTVYRVIAPNRLIPVYILNFGAYKVDVRTALTDGQSNKLRPKIWKETDNYILLVYTQNRDVPNNRREGLVKFFYSYFDKKNRKLYHLNEGTIVPDNEFLIDNPISGALPFLMSQLNIENNKFFVCYSKKRLEDIIKNKGFSSLSPEQQNRLKTFQKNLNVNEVLIMLLE